MKLQVAFDDISLEKLFAVLEETHDDIDIIEFGTLSVIRYGLEPLKKIRALYPKATLLVDPKIMDAPIKIADDCFKAGADIVTVMSSSGIETCKKVLETARKYNKQVMVDLLADNDLFNKAKKLDELGFDYICVHSSKNENKAPLADFIKLKSIVKNSLLTIAGGVNLDNIENIVKENPDNIIVGSAIYNSDNPKETINKFKEFLGWNI